MLKNNLFVLVLMLFGVSLWAELSVENIQVQQRWPWNGLVDIDYEVVCDNADEDVYVCFTGIDNAANRSFPLRTLEGDGAANAVKPGAHRITWNMPIDEPGLHTGNFCVKIQVFSGSYPYLVIDLSGGTETSTFPVRYSSVAPDLTDDTCRTTELWLRLIVPGTFMMGSPEDELGHYNKTHSSINDNETLRQVTLTQPFYIGIFEVTQKQCQLVMGDKYSWYTGDTRPVDRVSYDQLRGTTAGAEWPSNNQVDEGSFFYVIRQKTSLFLDLPTEAQWEYACRAGTQTALNSGKNLTSIYSCSNLAEVGRYCGNQSDGKGGYTSDTTKVGSYLPNNWGLYDMHGNVREWVLDWYTEDLGTEDVTDPVGPLAGSVHTTRGGQATFSICNGEFAKFCRSASRDYSSNCVGFRIVCLPVFQ